LESVLYLVESNRNDPRSEGFTVVDPLEPSLLGRRGWNDHADDRIRDFFPPFPIQGDWTSPRLADLWRPLRVKGRVRAWNDFPTIDMVVPAFSQRAVDALGDILEANGELLPLEYEHGTWFAYNCRTVADIVDYTKSTVSLDCGVQKEIDHYTIYVERLTGLTLFRMRHDVGPALYSTQSFVDRARQAGLRNFDFEKIWSWPKGTIWYLENKKLRRQKKINGKPDLRGHSVVIRLGTGSKAKPNKRQREHVEMIMDSLDALLADPYAAYDAPVFGNLQGDEPLKGEHRLFLSCPDADRLVEHLRPWLRHLDWPGSVEVVKRYGDLYDEGAREETIRGPW
jgi:hypothetical protein